MRTSQKLYADLWARMPFSPRQWPSLLFALGLAMVFVALGSDLIGLGDGTGMGPKQFAILGVGPVFMFRLMVYMYTIRHAKEKVSLSRSLSYFVMMPNVVSPSWISSSPVRYSH